jgi:hypothetical protein
MKLCGVVRGRAYTMRASGRMPHCATLFIVHCSCTVSDAHDYESYNYCVDYIHTLLTH